MRLPENRPPVHPGEVLREDCIRPLGMTISEAAERLRISRTRLSEVVNGRRGVTPDTALRLERLFGAEADFWLNLQQRWDLWHAMHSNAAADLDEIEPVQGDRMNDGGRAPAFA